MSENISIEEILRRTAAKKMGQTFDKSDDTAKAVSKSDFDDSANSIEDNADNTKTAAIPSIKSIPQSKVNASDDSVDNAKTGMVPPIKGTKTYSPNKKSSHDLKDTSAELQKDKTRSVNLGSVQQDETKKATNKSFFRNSNAKEPLFTKDPPEIIEKPATIKSRSKFNRQSDLQEVPTILAVEELEHTRIMGTMSATEQAEESAQIDDEVATQIKLEGFDDEIDKVSKIEENEAEAILKERRKEKVNKFRLSSSPDMTTDSKNHKIIKSDFRNIDEKSTITERLFAQKSNVQTSIVVTTLLGCLLLLLTLFRDTKYLPTFLLSNTSYFVAVIILFSLVIITNINNIIHAFNFSHGINYDLPIAICAVVVMVHTVMMVINPDMLIDSTGVFPSVVTLGFFLSSMGKREMLIRIIENFEFITDGNDKYTVETIGNSVDATIISRGFLSEEPDIKTSIRTDFPTNFLEIACTGEPADKIASRTGMVMIVLNAVLLGAMMFITKSFFLSFNCAVCGLCISMPAVSMLTTNMASLGVSRTLISKKSMVNGFCGAAMVDDTNAMIIEAHDLFGATSCDIQGFKTFNGAKIDEAILQTAAVIIKTKSPLAHAFDNTIVGKQSILPNVDGIVYEDKMGTSGWIYKKKILVGNRDLLANHGVQLPRQEFEDRYTRDGQQALYMAVAGKIMAMFIVTYSADPDLKRALKKLERSGITLLVRSCDPFINENSLNEMFSLPEGFVRVINASSGRAYEKYSDMHAEKSPAYVVHNGTSLGFIGAMRAAENLTETKSILSILISFGCAIGFGVVTLMSIIGGYNQLTPVNVLIFQAVWSAFVIFITRIRRFDI